MAFARLNCLGVHKIGGQIFVSLYWPSVAAANDTF